MVPAAKLSGTLFYSVFWIKQLESIWKSGYIHVVQARKVRGYLLLEDTEIQYNNDF